MEYDFDDVLDSFETKFAKTLAEREPLAEAAAKHQALRPLDVISQYNPHDFPEELALLLKEVRGIVIENRRKSSTGSPSSTVSGDVIEKDIGREVMRAEIRSTLTKLKSLDDTVTEGEDMTSSQSASFASMKRRLRENGQEIGQLRKQKKQLELKSRSQEESHETHLSKIRMLQNKESLAQTEKGELDAKVREQEIAVYHLSADKKRLERNVATLRTELLNSHHKLSEQKLKTTQAERKIADLESRQGEMRDNENVLSERVKELHEVQGEMLEEMKSVVDSKDEAGARRALTNLAQKRSRIVGRIANLLTKKNSMSREDRQESNKSDKTDPTTEVDLNRADSGALNFAGNNDTGESSRLISSRSRRASTNSNGDDLMSPPAVTRKSSIMQIFRIGGSGNQSGNQSQSFGGRQRSNEQSTVVQSPLSKNDRQQIYETNLVKSREAAERNTDVLRDVVSNKSSEIEKLEDQLREAKEEAERLEIDLQNERMNRRKENRNLHIAEEKEPKKQLDKMIRERNRPSTLFDWQSQDKDSDTAVAAPRKSAVEPETSA